MPKSPANGAGLRVYFLEAGSALIEGPFGRAAEFRRKGARGRVTLNSSHTHV